MFTLFYSPGACSLGVHMALIHYKMPFNLIKVDLATHTTADGGDFYTINPKGYVPALKLESGEVLTEAAAILMYIAAQQPSWKSESAIQHYRLQEWLIFVSTELHKGFGPFFNKKLPEESKIIAREKLAKRLDFLETKLKPNSFLMGNDFSVADAYSFVILRWIKFVNTGLDIESWPNVNAYYAKLVELPATVEAVNAEGLKF